MRLLRLLNSVVILTKTSWDLTGDIATSSNLRALVSLPCQAPGGLLPEGWTAQSGRTAPRYSLHLGTAYPCVQYHFTLAVSPAIPLRGRANYPCASAGKPHKYTGPSTDARCAHYRRTGALSSKPSRCVPFARLGGARMGGFPDCRLPSSPCFPYLTLGLPLLSRPRALSGSPRWGHCPRTCWLPSAH